MKNLMLVFPSFALSSCVLFDPYVHTTSSNIENAKSTKQISYELRKTLENSASSQSWYSKGSSTVLASLLGLGAYKGLTGGGSHQIAALATGAGVTYGLHEVLYTPTREQIYLGSVDTLLCLDRIYDGFDSSVGQLLAAKYFKNPRWSEYAPRYYQYLSVVQGYEAEYRHRVLQVPADVNQRLSAQQLTPGQSFALITNALSINKPPVPKPAAAMFPEGEAGVENDPALLFPDVEDWVRKAAQRASDFTDEQCKAGGALAPSIVRSDNGTVQTIALSKSVQYPLQNTSGILSTSVTPQANSDKDAVESKIIADKGAFWLEIDGKAATTKPVWVSIIDHGRSGASEGVWVEVK
ncbi:hypothetical protein [Pseudomonas sp. SDO52101_S400]